MTIKKLIEKYIKLTEEGYETMFITQVISDLRKCRRIRKEK